MTRILVLYEDSRARTGDFGFHEFLLGCVADDTSRPVHDLRKEAKANPVNGVAKLLTALRDEDRLSKLAPGGIPILAIVDSDRIKDHLGTPGQSVAEIEAGVRNQFSHPDRLAVVLLERNLESVLAAVRDCAPPLMFPTDLIADALAKDLNARDRLLTKVAHDTNRQSLRDCVRAMVPSLERAIAAIRSALAA